MTILALVLFFSISAFAGEKTLSSPAAADTVQVVVVDSAQYYVAHSTFQLKNLSLARTSAEAIALGKIARRMYGHNDTAVEYAMGGGLAHKCEFTQPEKMSNGAFRVTATVMVSVPKK